MQAVRTTSNEPSRPARLALPVCMAAMSRGSSRGSGDTGSFAPRFPRFLLGWNLGDNGTPGGLRISGESEPQTGQFPASATCRNSMGGGLALGRGGGEISRFPRLRTGQFPLFLRAQVSGDGVSANKR